MTSSDDHLGKQDWRKLSAYTLPMLLFTALLGLGSILKTPGRALWLASPEFWIFPLQTLLCGTLVIYFRREYQFPPLRRPVFTLGLGLLVFLIWIAPQQFFRFEPRLVGFNPDVFAGSSAQYWTTVALRFLRLVIVVPLVEEIFWRGFLLRFLIAERFDTVPFGTFSWPSFGVVTTAFGLSHLMADWPAAFLTGALYNFIAYRTKSLTSCALAHGATNLALGLWIMATKQWGFW